MPRTPSVAGGRSGHRRTDLAMSSAGEHGDAVDAVVECPGIPGDHRARTGNPRRAGQGQAVTAAVTERSSPSLARSTFAWTSGMVPTAPGTREFAPADRATAAIARRMREEKAERRGRGKPHGRGGQPTAVIHDERDRSTRQRRRDDQQRVRDRSHPREVPGHPGEVSERATLEQEGGAKCPQPASAEATTPTARSVMKRVPAWSWTRTGWWSWSSRAACRRRTPQVARR